MRPHRPGRAPPERAASRRPRRRAAATPPRARSGRLPARARRFVATGPPRTTRGVSIRSAIGTNPVKLELVSRRPARACREWAGGRARLPSAGPCDPPVQGGVGVMTEPRVSGADESARTVVVAVVANLLVAVAKGGAAALTGSAALAAETTHSIADTFNEVLLYIGVRRGARPPDDRHPFRVRPGAVLLVAAVGGRHLRHRRAGRAGRRDPVAAAPRAGHGRSRRRGGPARVRGARRMVLANGAPAAARRGRAPQPRPDPAHRELLRSQRDHRVPGGLRRADRHNPGPRRPHAWRRDRVRRARRRGEPADRAVARRGGVPACRSTATTCPPRSADWATSCWRCG